MKSSLKTDDFGCSFLFAQRHVYVGCRNHGHNPQDKFKPRNVTELGFGDQAVKIFVGMTLSVLYTSSAA